MEQLQVVNPIHNKQGLSTTKKGMLISNPSLCIKDYTYSDTYPIGCDRFDHMRREVSRGSSPKALDIPINKFGPIVIPEGWRTLKKCLGLEVRIFNLENNSVENFPKVFPFEEGSLVEHHTIIHLKEYLKKLLM